MFKNHEDQTVNSNRRPRLQPWMLLYVALLASVGLAGQQDARLNWDASGVSPVSLDVELPSIRLDALARRSDI